MVASYADRRKTSLGGCTIGRGYSAVANHSIVSLKSISALCVMRLIEWSHGFIYLFVDFGFGTVSRTIMV